MKTTEHFDIQVIIATGVEAPCRAEAGFLFALAAASADLRVAVFLTTTGATWALNDSYTVELSCGAGTMRRDIRKLIAELQECGARVEVCAACIGDTCDITETAGDLGRRPLLDGITIAGMVTVASRAASTSIVTF